MKQKTYIFIIPVYVSYKKQIQGNYKLLTLVLHQQYISIISAGTDHV